MKKVKLILALMLFLGCSHGFAEDFSIKLKKGMPYEEARKLLINAGWRPIVAHSTAKGAPLCFKVKDTGDSSLASDEACKYKEIDSCSGSGVGFCAMKFFDGKDTYLTVTTVGGEPPDANVNSWQNVKSNRAGLDRGQDSSKEKVPSGNQASKPSFDCEKAKSLTERLICSDVELSQMDRDLAASYARAKAVAPDLGDFQRNSAKEWRFREETCKTKECLITWFDKRKAQLDAIASRTGSVLNLDAGKTRAIEKTDESSTSAVRSSSSGVSAPLRRPTSQDRIAIFNMSQQGGTHWATNSAINTLVLTFNAGIRIPACANKILPLKGEIQETIWRGDDIADKVYKGYMNEAALKSHGYHATLQLTKIDVLCPQAVDLIRLENK